MVDIADVDCESRNGEDARLVQPMTSRTKAEPTEEGVNILIATGLIEGTAKFTSVSASTIFKRCEKPPARHPLCGVIRIILRLEWQLVQVRWAQRDFSMITEALVRLAVPNPSRS
jgi:hypothetical protein